MNTTCQPSQDTLRDIGEDVRAGLEAPIGNCGTASKRFKHALKQAYGISADVRTLAVGEARQTHIVNTVACEEIAGCPDAGRLLVDCTLDQFCSENQDHRDIMVDLGLRSTLPEVGIFEPSA
jgi:hypothetical protein